MRKGCDDSGEDISPPMGQVDEAETRQRYRFVFSRSEMRLSYSLAARREDEIKKGVNLLGRKKEKINKKATRDSLGGARVVREPPGNRWRLGSPFFFFVLIFFSFRDFCFLFAFFSFKLAGRTVTSWPRAASELSSSKSPSLVFFMKKRRFTGRMSNDRESKFFSKFQ